MDTSEVSFKKSATNYGLILGGILAGATALLYAIDIEFLSIWWIGIIFFFITLALGIVSTAKSKSLLGGFISFKLAFTSYLITVAIGLFCAVIINILIFNVVDPEGGEYLMEQALKATEAFMERLGTPQEIIDESMAKAAETNSFSVLKQLESYVYQLAFYLVFGLLVALIMKRKNPNSISN